MEVVLLPSQEEWAGCPAITGWVKTANLVPFAGSECGAVSWPAMWADITVAGVAWLRLSASTNRKASDCVWLHRVRNLLQNRGREDNIPKACLCMVEVASSDLQENSEKKAWDSRPEARRWAVGWRQVMESLLSTQPCGDPRTTSDRHKDSGPPETWKEEDESKHVETRRTLALTKPHYKPQGCVALVNRDRGQDSKPKVILYPALFPSEIKWSFTLTFCIDYHLKFLALFPQSYVWSYLTNSSTLRLLSKFQFTNNGFCCIESTVKGMNTLKKKYFK